MLAYECVFVVLASLSNTLTITLAKAVLPTKTEVPSEKRRPPKVIS